MRIVTVLPHQKQLAKGHSKELSRKARRRLEMIDWYNQVSGRKDASLTCRRFGIGRSYFYRWYGRLKKQGIAGLEDRPRRVRRESVSAEIVEEIRRIRRNLRAAEPNRVVEFDMKRIRIPNNGRKHAMVAIDVAAKQAVIHVSNTCTSASGKIAYQKVVARFGRDAVYVNDNGGENQGEAERRAK